LALLTKFQLIKSTPTTLPNLRGAYGRYTITVTTIAMTIKMTMTMTMTITAIQDSFPGMDHSRDYTLSIFHKDLLSVHLPLAPLKPILLEDLSDKSSVTFFTLS
jgi:hypothetical protein